MFASGTKKAVPHLSLICWLCEDAECDLFSNDLSASMMKPLTDTYMDTFVRDYHERLHQIQVAGQQQDNHNHPHLSLSQYMERGAINRLRMHLFILCCWITC